MSNLSNENRVDDVLRGSSLGNFKVESVSISSTVLSAVPVTITGVTTGSWASVTDVQSIADAVSEIVKLLQ